VDGWQIRQSIQADTMDYGLHEYEQRLLWVRSRPIGVMEYAINHREKPRPEYRGLALQLLLKVNRCNES
jgi:hypothetical protein